MKKVGNIVLRFGWSQRQTYDPDTVALHDRGMPVQSLSVHRIRYTTTVMNISLIILHEMTTKNAFVAGTGFRVVCVVLGL
jgi:hypothetical protein